MGLNSLSQFRQFLHAKFSQQLHQQLKKEKNIHILGRNSTVASERDFPYCGVPEKALERSPASLESFPPSVNDL